MNNMNDYEKHITRELDSQFENIPKPYYMPWIGHKCKTVKGLEDKNTLLVGESVYNWKPSEKETQGKTNEEIIKLQDAINKRVSDPTFVRQLVFDHGLKNKKQSKFFKNIEQLLIGVKCDKNIRKQFWGKTCFTEYIQEPMLNVKQRPTAIQINKGATALVETLEILKPGKCIFFGTDENKYEPLKKLLKENYKIQVTLYPTINNASPKRIIIPKLKTTIYFIKHASMAFKVETWKRFLILH